MKVKGRIAIITGGGSGLGKATAQALIENGGKVAIFDLDRESGEAAAKKLGENARFFNVNVSDLDNVERAVSKVKEEFGALHIVINCAGIGGSRKISGKDGLVDKNWFTNIVNVNLIGTYNLIHSTIPYFQNNETDDNGERGIYINTSSIAAFDGQIGQSAYAASKGGVMSMTLPLAREFANEGIRVMTIMPGLFETPMLAKLNEAARVRLAKQVPFPERLGLASEFASLSIHIISNTYLNGECIRLDGSLRMGYGRK